MTLLELCDPQPAAVRLESGVAEAVQITLEKPVGAVGVIDSEQRIAGIFTERVDDLTHELDSLEQYATHDRSRG